MNTNIDQTIQEYLYQNFIDVVFPCALRDTKLEKKIITACSFNSYIRQGIIRNCQKYAILSPCCLNDIKYNYFKNRNVFNLLDKSKWSSIILSSVLEINDFFIPIPIPFFLIHIRKNNISIEDAIIKLQKQQYAISCAEYCKDLDSFQEIDMDSVKYPFSVNKFHLLHRGNNCSGMGYITFYSNNYDRKIIIPLILYVRNPYEPYIFSLNSLSYYNKIDLFGSRYMNVSSGLNAMQYGSSLDKNKRYIFKTNRIIIITDSIELTDANNFSINDKIAVIWISWYGDAEGIDKYDWEILKDEKVYYLLYPQHCSLESSYDTAKQVKKKLKGIAKSFQYIMMSYRSSPHSRQMPTFQILPKGIDTDNTDVLQAWKILANKIIQTKPPRIPQILLNSPIFYTSSISCIYGTCLKEISLFAMNLALGVVYGKNTLQGWNCLQQNVQVIYIYNNQYINYFEDALSDCSKIYDLHAIDAPYNNFIQEPIFIDEQYDIYLDTYIAQILARVNSICDQYIRPDRHTILCLDKIFPLNQAPIDQQQLLFFESLKLRNIATVIIPRFSIKNMKIWPFDNIIKISKAKSKKTSIQMLVYLEAHKLLQKKTKRKFYCEFKEGRKSNTFKVIRKSSNKKIPIRERQHIVEQVKELHSQEMKIKDIAKKIKLNESWVKKIQTILKKNGYDVIHTVQAIWK